MKKPLVFIAIVFLAVGASVRNLQFYCDLGCEIYNVLSDNI